MDFLIIISVSVSNRKKPHLWDIQMCTVDAVWVGQFDRSIFLLTGTSNVIRLLNAMPP